MLVILDKLVKNQGNAIEDYWKISFFSITIIHTVAKKKCLTNHIAGK